MPDPALEALLAVQDLDAALDRARHRLRTLPERTELADLTTRAAAVVARRETLVAQRDEIAGREQALEDELRSSEDRIKAVEKRMYSGEVSAARDLQAMAADVVSLQARASDLEDRALEALGEREPLDEAVTELDADLASLAESAAAAQGRLAEAETAVQAEVSSLNERRQDAAAQAPTAMFPEYERLRARLGGVAVARLVGSRCDGCHLTLTALELDRIRHQPADALVTCDNCGRILVRP